MDRIGLFTLWLILVGLQTGCTQPAGSADIIEVIQTGPGPEDLVVQVTKNSFRLLISASSRRQDSEPFGEIQAWDPTSGEIKNLIRQGEPGGLHFRPHGIDLVQQPDQDLLFVISHDEENGRHPIIRYRIAGDTLVFDRLFEHELIVSPNALTVFADGSFMVCNDAAKRGNRMEQILGRKKASIISVSAAGEYQVAIAGLGMPAGINHLGDQVFVSAATENKIYAFDRVGEKLINKRVLTRLRGPDNLRWQDSSLLVAAHLKTLRFIRHVSESDVASPTSLYRINPTTGQKHLVFLDSGELISAGSVGVCFGGHYFIGQIFEPWIVEIKNPGGDPGFLKSVK